MNLTGVTLGGAHSEIFFTPSGAVHIGDVTVNTAATFNLDQMMFGSTPFLIAVQGTHEITAFWNAGRLANIVTTPYDTSVSGAVILLAADADGPASGGSGLTVTNGTGAYEADNLGILTLTPTSASTALQVTAPKGSNP